MIPVNGGTGSEKPTQGNVPPLGPCPRQVTPPVKPGSRFLPRAARGGKFKGHLSRNSSRWRVEANRGEAARQDGLRSVVDLPHA